MSITDELREWAHGFTDLYASNERQLLAIADRIDEQVSKMYTDLTIGLEPMTDESMAEHGWVHLPVDAGGKVIHVEDEVELLDGSKRFKAEWLEWDGEDWVVHETIGYGAYHEPSALRHAKPDTWERIIGDALTVGWQNGNWNEVASAEIHERLVERCKRLAGE